MDITRELLALVDAVLIAPFRWPAEPMAGWWLGVSALSAWAVLVGEATLAVVFRINRRHVDELTSSMRAANQEAMSALKAGDKSSYQALNRKANDLFGKAFFLQIAMGAAGLWPAFLAVAWLEPRFAGVVIPLPLLAEPVRYIAVYILVYLLMRLAWAWLKKRLKLWPGLAAMRREMAARRRGGSKTG